MGKLKTKDDLGVDLSFLSSGPSTSKASSSKPPKPSPAEKSKPIHFKTNEPAPKSSNSGFFSRLFGSSKKAPEPPMPKVPGMRPQSRITSSAVTRSTSSTAEKKPKKKHSKEEESDEDEGNDTVADYRDAYRQRLPWEIDPAPNAKPTWEEEEEKRLKAERKAARKYAKQIDSKYGLTPEDDRPGRVKKGKGKKEEEEPEEDDFFKQLDRGKAGAESEDEAPRANGKTKPAAAKKKSKEAASSDESEGDSDGSEDSDDSEAQRAKKKAAAKKKQAAQRSGASSSSVAPVRYGMGPLPPATPPPAVPDKGKGKKGAEKKDKKKEKKGGKDVKVEVASGARNGGAQYSLGWGGI